MHLIVRSYLNALIIRAPYSCKGRALFLERLRNVGFKKITIYNIYIKYR